MSALTGTEWRQEAARWWKLKVPDGPEVAGVIWDAKRQGWLARAGDRHGGPYSSLKAAMLAAQDLASGV
jgi:hypothetical protein